MNWEDLKEPPRFLTQAKEFGTIYLFDDLRKIIFEGWLLFHNEKEVLRLEHLGGRPQADIRRANDDLIKIIRFLESLFGNEIQTDKTFSFEVENRFLNIYGSRSLRDTILLQLTKPNAYHCKYTIEEWMHFPGYWDPKDFEIERDPFELKFQYSSDGYKIVLKNDYHVWHQYGDVVPMKKGMSDWIQRTLQTYSIEFLATDACTYELNSMADFLHLTNVFKERTSL